MPAYWFEPRRCHYRDIGGDIGLLSARFTAFKLGEMAYAYPFALAIFEQLRTRDLIEFDCIVPIPLSPDKAANGEQHRTRALAGELSRLLAVPVREALRLTRSISKRQMRAVGPTKAQFERACRDALQADIPPAAERVLLVDDVMTHGSTISAALAVIHATRPITRVVVATAGQMIVKAAVVRTQGFNA